MSLLIAPTVGDNLPGPDLMLDFCVTIALASSLALPSAGLVASTRANLAPAEKQLTNKQKLAKAKKLYAQAEGLAAEEKWAEAADLYEQAYYLVPGKHGFAHKVGEAAFKAGDCDRAQDYLIHFLQYGDHDKHQDKLDQAQQTLEELEDSGCASQATDMKVDAHGNPVDSDDPFAAQEADDDDSESSSGKGLLAGGAVMIGLGAAGLVVGAVGASKAAGTRDEIEDLGGENPAGITGYAAGFYDCDGNPGPCAPDLEGQFESQKLMATVGFVAGGVLLAGGAALLAVYLIKRKRGDASESAARLDALGPTWLVRGAGVAAQLSF